MPDILGVEAFVKSSGQIIALAALFAIIFAETGLLIGFFLPGDSLLFTAGILASQGYLNIALLCITLFFAAVIGDSTGYQFGKHVGRRLFKRDDSLLFHKDHLRKANRFYQKHGGKTIILARFMPIIRTFAPVVAGIGDMEYKKFLAYNVVGGLLWATGVPLAGYFLGKLIPDIDKFLLPIIVVIVLASIAPGIYELLKTKEQRIQLLSIVKKLLSPQKE
ncbi:MAG TPA: VTT domain-containing protein [Patescibacteria group bacterium]|nr:VTT domain-containing protein [Patescibacteria group bacterium]